MAGSQAPAATDGRQQRVREPDRGDRRERGSPAQPGMVSAWLIRTTSADGLGKSSFDVLPSEAALDGGRIDAGPEGHRGGLVAVVRSVVRAAGRGVERLECGPVDDEPLRDRTPVDAGDDDVADHFHVPVPGRSGHVDEIAEADAGAARGRLLPDRDLVRTDRKASSHDGRPAPAPYGLGREAGGLVPGDVDLVANRDIGDLVDPGIGQDGLLDRSRPKDSVSTGDAKASQSPQP